MKRPWQVWLVFLVCVVGAAGAMAWLTRQAFDADRMRRVAEAEAELEQRVSLALWRMDTELAPIVAEEVIRPPSAYRPLADTPVDPPKYVLLQFEARPDGTWQSPQAPLTYSSELPQLVELSRAVDLPQLLAKLPDTPLPTAADLNKSIAATQATRAQESIEWDDPFHYFEGNTAWPSAPPEKLTKEPVPEASGKGGGKVARTKSGDLEERGERYQTAARQSLMNQQQRNAAANLAPNTSPDLPPAYQAPVLEHVEQVGVSRPVWVGERLLLARRVGGNGETVIQGSWLDWPALKKRLLTEATSLLRDADLVAVEGEGRTDPARMLAGLPVRLVVSEGPVAGAMGTPMRWALWMGWGAVLLAAAAAAALLHGVMTLSERRAAFVSSVTHELRTPLTTFRMYAEMLARGMVPDAARRQEYFQTLQREAERLTLLVENVLAYARLERGRKPLAHDRTTVVELLKRVRLRLEQRAIAAGMECVVELNKKTAAVELTTDLAVVEQILFNLVDNAAKYARSAADKHIHVEANHAERFITLSVRDHGPGIERNGRLRRIQPFGKSAQESAETAPGVGLGLALCQRLARQLGGGLDIGPAPGGGAMATLMLPAS
jgi:signal transduction histidine kinase